MAPKKRAKKAEGTTVPKRYGEVPEGVFPIEPSDAGGSTPRTEPPVYPDDYNLSGQPNYAPEEPEE